MRRCLRQLPPAAHGEAGLSRRQALSERYTKTAIHFEVERFRRSSPVRYRRCHSRSLGGGLASDPRLLRALRIVKVPIPGYYDLELVVER